MDKTRKNSKEYWDKIKFIGQLEFKNKNRKKKIPELVQNNVKASTNMDKAQLFGSMLEKVLSNENVNSFDEENRLKVEGFINTNKNNLFKTRIGDESFDDNISLVELEDCLKTLNKKSAPGNDGIRNLSLTNLSYLGKIKCLEIFNQSLMEGHLIKD